MKDDLEINIEEIVLSTRNLFQLLRTDPEDFEDGRLPDFILQPVVIQNEVMEFSVAMRNAIRNYIKNENIIGLLASLIRKKIKETMIHDSILFLRSLTVHEDIEKCAFNVLIWGLSEVIEYEISDSDFNEESEDSSEENEKEIEKKETNIIQFNEE